MRLIVIALFLILAPAGAALADDNGLPPTAVAKETALLGKLTPRAWIFIRTQARDQAEFGAALTPAMAAERLGPRLEGLDMETLVFLVTMQAARDADAEMRGIMDEHWAAGARRQALREVQARNKAGGERRRSPGNGSAPLNAGTGLGGLVRTSPTVRQRLLQAMDCYAQAIATLTAVMETWERPVAVSLRQGRGQP